MILNPGNYTLSIVVNDMNNTVNFDSVSMEIDVKNFGSSIVFQWKLMLKILVLRSI